LLAYNAHLHGAPSLDPQDREKKASKMDIKNKELHLHNMALEDRWVGSGSCPVSNMRTRHQFPKSPGNL